MKSLYIYISALCGAGLLVGLALVYISGTSSIRMAGAVSAILATNVIMIYAKKLSESDEIGSENGNE